MDKTTSQLAPLALAFGAGVLGAEFLASDSAVAERAAVLLWGAALAFAVAWKAGRRGAGMVLVIAMLTGATRMAVQKLDGPLILPPGTGMDDRVMDEVTGIVKGPIEDTGSGWRFVLQSSGPAELPVLVHAPAEARVWPGDRVVVTGFLQRPRGYRVPGAMDMERQVRTRGARVLMRARDIEVVEARATFSLWRSAAVMQARASARIAERGRPGDPATGVVRAMVTGDRGGLDQDITDRFRAAGASHVLAVSGLHLAVVTMLVFIVVRFLWALTGPLAARVEPVFAAALCAAPAALGYTMLTGARISTLRALLVVLLVLAGILLSRRTRLVDALGLAALIVLMHRPTALWDPSFQLSFAATATLALLFSGQRDRAEATLDGTAAARPGLARRLGRRLWDLTRASLWTGLATAPLSALAFAEVATGGPVTNLVAVPLTELAIVPLGLAGSALSELWPAAGGMLIDGAVVLAGWLCQVVAAVAARAPVVKVYPPNAWELGGVCLMALAAVQAARGCWRRPRVWAVATAGGCVIAMSLWVTTCWAPAHRDDVRITFLDVGQGDAAIIELPGGAVWMIDGGGMPFVAGPMSEKERRRIARLPGLRSVARYLAWRRIGRIDLLILSHPHPDHYEGVHALLPGLTIDRVWVARGYEHTAPSYRELLHNLAAAGAAIVHPRLGEPLSHGPVTLTTLAPRYLDAVATADPVSGINDNSLVVRLTAFGRTVLFAGDIEREGEELLLQSGQNLGADLVKVPHHGSRTSSTRAFVAATAPAWAIISCGVANRFDFPAAEVVSRWQRAGARVLVTARAGAVTAVIRPDGELLVHGLDGDGP